MSTATGRGGMSHARDGHVDGEPRGRLSMREALNRALAEALAADPPSS